MQRLKDFMSWKLNVTIRSIEIDEEKQNKFNLLCFHSSLLARCRLDLFMILMMPFIRHKNYNCFANKRSGERTFAY